MDKYTRLRHIETEVQTWGHRMIEKYPWLTIKYNFSRKENVILVSFYGEHLENDLKFSTDALAFEDKMNAEYGDNAPLFCDNEGLFSLLGNPKIIRK